MRQEECGDGSLLDVIRGNHLLGVRLLPDSPSIVFLLPLSLFLPFSFPLSFSSCFLAERLATTPHDGPPHSRRTAKFRPPAIPDVPIRRRRLVWPRVPATDAAVSSRAPRACTSCVNSLSNPPEGTSDLTYRAATLPLPACRPDLGIGHPAGDAIPTLAQHDPPAAICSPRVQRLPSSWRTAAFGLAPSALAQYVRPSVSPHLRIRLLGRRLVPLPEQQRDWVALVLPCE